MFSLWSSAHFWVVITSQYEISVVDERNGGLIIHEHTQQETKAVDSNIITETGGWLSCESEHVKQFMSGRMCTREWEASLPFTRKPYSRKRHCFMCELPTPAVLVTELDPGSPSGGRKMSAYATRRQRSQQVINDKADDPHSSAVSSSPMTSDKMVSLYLCWLVAFLRRHINTVHARTWKSGGTDSKQPLGLIVVTQKDGWHSLRAPESNDERKLLHADMFGCVPGRAPVLH